MPHQNSILILLTKLDEGRDDELKLLYLVPINIKVGGSLVEVDERLVVITGVLCTLR